MKKLTYLTRLLIIGLFLCSPIGFTQMGWTEEKQMLTISLINY